MSKAYIRIKELYRLLDTLPNSSQEAEDVRDEMDTLWKNMGSEERAKFKEELASTRKGKLNEFRE